MKKVKIIFNASKLKLKGKYSYLKFVIDKMDKGNREICLSVYSDLQRIHRIDNYALRLSVRDGKLFCNSFKKLNHLIESYGFQDLGIKGIKQEIEQYIENIGFISFEEKVKAYIKKWRVQGEQLKDLEELCYISLD